MLVKGGSRSVDGMESYYDVSVLQTTVTFLAILKLNITHGLVVVVVGYWLINRWPSISFTERKLTSWEKQGSNMPTKDSSRTEMQSVTPHVLLARNTKRKGGLLEM